MSNSENGNLVLNRKFGESLNIYAGDHKIVITRLQSDRIGIRADKCVKVLRSELESVALDHTKQGEK